MKLAGKRLDIDTHILRVGIPEVRMLRPRDSLYSRLVTIKGFMEPPAFVEAAKRQLEKLGVDITPQVGERRTFRIKDKQVVGFEMTVSTLSEADSLRLQEAGIGGRRKIGCGIFLPAAGKQK